MNETLDRKNLQLWLNVEQWNNRVEEVYLPSHKGPTHHWKPSLQEISLDIATNEFFDSCEKTFLLSLNLQIEITGKRQSKPTTWSRMFITCYTMDKIPSGICYFAIVFRRFLICTDAISCRRFLIRSTPIDLSLFQGTTENMTSKRPPSEAQSLGNDASEFQSKRRPASSRGLVNS